MLFVLFSFVSTHSLTKGFFALLFFPSFNVFLVRFSGKLNIYSEV